VIFTFAGYIVVKLLNTSFLSQLPGAYGLVGQPVVLVVIGNISMHIRSPGN